MAAVDWWFLVPLVCAIISLVGSAALWIWVNRVKGRFATKLMARQLWHLALADVLSSAMSIARVGYLGGFVSDGDKSAVCLVATLFNIPAMTSVFVEIHIALSMASSVFHWANALNFLFKLLPMVWVLGFAFGLWVIEHDESYWNNDEHICITSVNGGEVIRAGVLTVALCICLAIYLGVALMVMRNAGESVQVRVFRRVRLFMIAAIIGRVPYVVFELVARMVGKKESPSFTFSMSLGLLLLNGVLNAAVYLRKSRFARQAWRHARGRREASLQPSKGASEDVASRKRQSFEITFGEVGIAGSPENSFINAASNDDNEEPGEVFMNRLDFNRPAAIEEHSSSGNQAAWQEV